MTKLKMLDDTSMLIQKKRTGRWKTILNFSRKSVRKTTAAYQVSVTRTHRIKYAHRIKYEQTLTTEDHIHREKKLFCDEMLERIDDEEISILYSALNNGSMI